MKINSIAKNTSFFTFALILQKIISFSYFVILARNLNPADLGKYYLAISFTTIFAILIDLGLANVLIRETAKQQASIDKKSKNNLLRTVIFIKLPLAFIVLVATISLANILSYSLLVRQLICISTISMVLDSFTLTFWSYIRGFHVLQYESIGVVFYQLIVFVVGYIFLKLEFPLLYLMMVMALASLLNFLLAFGLLKIKFQARIAPLYQVDLLKKILSLSVPFALFAVLQRLYMYLDAVLLSVLAGDMYVGLYQIAFKIIFSLQFLPMAFMASLYPAFASYYKNNQEQLAISFSRALNYLLIIAWPVSLGIFILADKIILFFKPEYTQAILPLQIIILSLVFIFVNFPIGAMLNACNRQKINTHNMAIVLAISVIMNLFLIPHYQALGAAITVLITNVLMFVLGAYYVRQVVQIEMTKLFKATAKIFLASLLMGIFTILFKENINIFINIVISAIIYTGTLFLVGGFKKEDIISIFQSFQKKE